MNRLRKFAGMCSLLVVMAAPMAAQDVVNSADHVRPTPPVSTPVTPSPTSLVVTPASAQFSAAAVLAPVQAAKLSPEVTGAHLAARRAGQGSTLMIVGGAAVLTGILIDEHVITVAGALVGLYGLYLYVR